MRKKSKRSRSSSRVEIPSTFKAIALIVLTLVVVVLCYLAIRHGRGNASAAPSVSATAPEVSAPVDTAQPESSTPAEAPDPASPAIASPTQILVATGTDSAYRAIVGSCPDGGSSIDATDDGGATWSSFDISTRLGIGAIQSVSPGGTGYASFVGLNLQDCSSASAGQTYTSGNDWEIASRALGTTWYLDPTNPQALIGPGGVNVEAPCALGRLTSNGDESVAGVCTDGRIVSSSDSGASWNQSDSIEGIDALTFANDRLIAGTVGQPSCADGVALQILDSSLSVTGETCVPAGASTAGQTSISEAPDGTLWLLAGENVLRSSDEGANWD